jgi:hypothetical protein
MVWQVLWSEKSVRQLELMGKKIKTGFCYIGDLKNSENVNAGKQLCLVFPNAE